MLKRNPACFLRWYGLHMILLTTTLSLHASPVVSDTIAQTAYFSFHSNPWVNLHHFLYERASHRQEEHLTKDNVSFLTIGEEEVETQLSEAERATLAKGVAFYERYVIDQSLLGSGRVLKWLHDQKADAPISDTSFSRAFTETLNATAALYRAHFWPVHHRHNLQVLEQHKATIQAAEQTVIRQMETFSGSAWNQRVRVDISTYGNWAGAYSPADDNIVVSTIDPAMQTSLFVEFVFHEGAHLLFGRSSPFRQALFKGSRSLGLNYPKQLWHAAMFYLCGRATTDALASLEMPHSMVMEEKGVFLKHYYNPSFRTTLDTYYKAGCSMDEMAQLLLTGAVTD